MKRVPIEESWLTGAVSVQRGDGWVKPWRLPCDELPLFPPEDGLVQRGGAPAGVRLRIRTASRSVGVEVEPSSDDRLFDLALDNELVQSVRLPYGERVARFDDLPADDKTLEIWLHHTSEVRLRALLVDDGTRVAAACDDRRRWVTYGSSITHCGSAHSPGRTWPATAARMRDLHLTCLGYGGNCHIEPMVARMIRDLPADVITLKLGINVQGASSLSPRTFRPAVIGLVRIIREKHPTTPMAVVSPIISPPRETTPNAVGLSLQDIRREIEDAVGRLVQSGDENLRYFHGLDLFGADLAADYLPDELHPSGDGHEILGRNFAGQVLETMGF